MPTEQQWQHIREIIAIILGTLTLVAGIRQNEPAMMTIGAGLVGFSPAAKGPPASDVPHIEVP